MKIETKEVGFSPIELTLTIESIEELSSLWHRFNVQGNQIEADSTSGLNINEYFDHEDVWRVLNEFAIKNGLK